MKIYQNLGINSPEKANFPAGTVGFPYKIVSARIIEKLYCNQEALMIEAKKENGKKLSEGFGYVLIGQRIFGPFLEKMNSKPEKGLINRLFKKTPLKRLIGKDIFAFIAPDRFEIQGISPMD